MSLEHCAWTMAAQGKYPVRALTGLLHRFPEHDMSRCQLVASLLLTMWQLGGRTFSSTPPSFLLINANGENDAVWQALAGMLKSPLAPINAAPAKPLPFDPNNIFRGNPELSRRTMQAIIARLKNLEQQGLPPPLIEAEMARWRKQWCQCKPEVFPALEINHYNKAHDPDFGWVTHSDNHLSLLIDGPIIDGPKSEAELRRDLLDKQSKLHHPDGFCDDLSRWNKKLALMGRITGESWDASLADGVVRSPLPVVFLPHLSPPPDAVPHPDADLLASMVTYFTRHQRTHCPPASVDLHGMQMDGEPAIYADLILRASAGLPGDRRFGLQLLVRELQLVVSRLCLWLLPAGEKLSTTQLVAIKHLSRDLYTTALRGIAYGVAALGFHGRGFGLGGDRPAAMKILSHLRTVGTCSRRDLQRKLYKLDAKERDRLLSRLVEASLVSTADKDVEAVPLGDYLTGIPGRLRFPLPALATTPAYMAGMEGAAAAQAGVP